MIMIVEPELPRFRSKPQVVEAVPWTGAESDLGPIFDLAGHDKVRRQSTELLSLFAGKDGAQDWVDVPIGHWFVRNPGDRSDVWPVADPFFRVKYELIEDD